MGRGAYSTPYEHPVKTSSKKHGIANVSVVLTEYVSLVTFQSGTGNLVQPGLILSKSHYFLEASLDLKVEIRCVSSKLDKVLMF